MPLPDKCPKCGEKATNDRGQCVFCGTQVVDPGSILTAGQKAKAESTYKFCSWAFMVLGSVYLLAGIIGTILSRSPMLGLLLTGIFGVVHSGLLLVRHELVQSVTKMICIARAVMLFWFIGGIIWFFPLYILPGILILAVVGFDIICLLMMANAIDDVYFG